MGNDKHCGTALTTTLETFVKGFLEVIIDVPLYAYANNLYKHANNGTALLQKKRENSASEVRGKANICKHTEDL